jgi:hypothetical protein
VELASAGRLVRSDMPCRAGAFLPIGGRMRRSSSTLLLMVGLAVSAGALWFAWLLHRLGSSCDSGRPWNASSFLVAGVLTLGPAALATRARARRTKSPNGGLGSGILTLALSPVTIVFATLLFGATRSCFG